MAVGLYLDVRVPRAIADQLRRRGVDVVTAIEDGSDQLSDEDLLDRASSLGRVLFTQDIRFKAMAEDWQRQGRPFGGLVFGHQRGARSASSSAIWKSSPRRPMRGTGWESSSISHSDDPAPTRN
jgi:Domain of unknown function (DUF5615)